jgi:hypothetical protein
MRRQVDVRGWRGLIVLLALVPVLLGVVTELKMAGFGSSVPATFQGDYETVATLSACYGDPAVGARNYASVAAVADTSVALWEVPQGANGAVFRFHIAADANTATVRAATARANYNPGDYRDDFNLAFQWAIVGGSQTDRDGAVYADTVTATTYNAQGGVPSTPDPNWIVEFDADLRGVGYMAFWRTDSDANYPVVIDAAVY